MGALALGDRRLRQALDRKKRDSRRQAITQDKELRRAMLSPEWRTVESKKLTNEGKEIARAVEERVMKEFGKRVKIKGAVVGSTMTGTAHSKSDLDLLFACSGISSIEQERWI